MTKEKSGRITEGWIRRAAASLVKKLNDSVDFVVDAIRDNEPPPETERESIVNQRPSEP